MSKNTQNIKKGKENEPEKSGLEFYPHRYISFSALNLFINCPYSFYLRYFCGVAPEKNEKMEFGIAFQNLLNAKYLDRQYKEYLERISKDKRELAEKLFKKSFDFDNVISADKPYEFDIGIGIPIRFVPDLLTKDSIVENKTTTGYYSKARVKNEMQMNLYYLGVRKKFGFNPKCYYQIFNLNKEKVELVELDKTTKHIEAAVSWIIDTMNKIRICYKTKKWDHGKHNLCGFPTTCPLTKFY